MVGLLSPYPRVPTCDPTQRLRGNPITLNLLLKLDGRNVKSLFSNPYLRSNPEIERKPYYSQSTFIFNDVEIYIITDPK